MYSNKIIWCIAVAIIIFVIKKISSRLFSIEKEVFVKFKETIFSITDNYEKNKDNDDIFFCEMKIIFKESWKSILFAPWLLIGIIIVIIYMNINFVKYSIYIFNNYLDKMNYLWGNNLDIGDVNLILAIFVFVMNIILLLFEIRMNINKSIRAYIVNIVVILYELYYMTHSTFDINYIILIYLLGGISVKFKLDRCIYETK